MPRLNNVYVTRNKKRRFPDYHAALLRQIRSSATMHKVIENVYNEANNSVVRPVGHCSVR